MRAVAPLPAATTRDLGLTIYRLISNRQCVLLLNDDCEQLGRLPIADIDASDAHNLRVYLENGQIFTVRIIAGARP